MSPSWSDDLATGYNVIDQDHKEIFKKINEFQLSCRLGRATRDLDSLILFLEQYILHHFVIEEGFMKRFSYEGYENHHARHDEFRTAISELRKEITQEGPGVHSAIAAHYLLGDWWRDHICKYDRHLAAFLIAEKA